MARTDSTGFLALLRDDPRLRPDDPDEQADLPALIEWAAGAAALVLDRYAGIGANPDVLRQALLAERTEGPAPGP